jgi:long-chain acyl-CoA synthetase
LLNTTTTLVERLWSTLEARGPDPLIWHRERIVSAAELLEQASSWRDRLAAHRIERQDVIAIVVDDSPDAIAVLLAALRLGAVAALIGRTQCAETDRLISLAGARHVVDPAEGVIRSRAAGPPHALIDRLRADDRAGLIVFTSGSTGEPKAILHDAERLLSKFFDMPRPGYRALQFLPIHHMGGVNTFLATACFGGVAVMSAERRPVAVARCIEAAAIELLPVTPTLLNLMIATGAHRGHDFGSVKLVTYGAEPVPEDFLARVQPLFPSARFHQTYGLSELGVLRTRSRASGSLWMKVGGPGCEVRVEDGLLHVRSKYAMLGYLNAPSPFDTAGWMNTGDAVIADGEWLRVLGRKVEMISVGAEKVFPAEVEAVLCQADNVVDAVCQGERDSLLGSRVIARVSLREPEQSGALRQRLRAFCLARLDRHKVPVRFEIVDRCLEEGDFKKKRLAHGTDPQILPSPRNFEIAAQEGVVTIYLARPDRRNALDLEVLLELEAAIVRAGQQPATRALEALETMTPEQGREVSAAGQRVIAALEHLPFPTIAAVDGVALGGGFELALGCDLIYASERAIFGLPELELGLIPAFGGLARLITKLGSMRAQELAWTARRLSAKAALEVGLILQILPSADLLAYCWSIARSAIHKMPAAVAHIKRAVTLQERSGAGPVAELEQETFARILSEPRQAARPQRRS